ncbi:MAG: hypothetical protein AAF479_13975 [Pseudomonadota bacterium]
MTDDLGMKALTGPMSERGTKALAAGCDVVLHCSGDMDEMRDLAPSMPTLQGDALRRAERAEAARTAPQADMKEVALHG